MPVSDGTIPGKPVRPRHAIDGNAILVYRGEKVYVAQDKPGAIDRIAQLPDVRRLPQEEAVDFEATLPGGGARSSHGHPRPGQAIWKDTSDSVGLGDVVSWLTSTLGIRECDACSQRKKRLNKFSVWRSGKGYGGKGAARPSGRFSARS
jgi:hypothetical protein